MLTRITNWAKRTFLSASSTLWGYSWRWGGELAYDTLSLQGYKRNPIAYRCINLVADSAAGVPWKLYEKKSDNRDVEVEQHPALDLLKYPNPRLSGKDFFTQFIQYYLVAGDAYVQSAGPLRTRTPKELYLLSPQFMTIQEGYYENSPDEFEGFIYIYAPPYGTERIDLHNFYHCRRWNPLWSPYGQSALEAAYTSIMQVNEALQWNVSLLRNCASPSGILNSKGNLTDDQRDRLKGMLKTDVTGQWNNGNPLVTEGDITFDRMGFSPHEMEWLEGVREACKHICLCLGVDPSLVGDSSHKTFNTFHDAEKSLYHSTVLPLLDMIRDDFLNRWLLPRFPGTENMFFQYDIEAIEVLSENRTEVWDRMIKGVQSGIISVNEAREELGYSEVLEPEKEELPTEQVPPDEEEDK